MPENRLAEHQSQGHLIHQSFERARRTLRPRKVRVCPSPEIAMPISAVMALHAKSQRIANKFAPIDCDPSRKYRVGMRRAREADPAFITKSHTKRRSIAQVPCNSVPIHLQRSAAEVFPNLVVTSVKTKWTPTLSADLKTLQRKSLNKTLWRAACRKPCRPRLHRHSARVPHTPASPRIHQQVSKPPCPAAVRQTHAHEPDFITPPYRQRGKRFIQSRQSSISGLNYCTISFSLR